MFRKLKGVNLSYERQGFVRFTCLTYNDQPEDMQRKINNLCLRFGGENWQALFELMTTRESPVSIALRYFISDMTLYRMRNKFYHGWYASAPSAPKKLPEIGLG